MRYVFLILLMVCCGLFASVALAGDSDSEEDSDKEDYPGEFTFGSYGRVQITDDTEGHQGRNTNVVAHGPRIFEPSYGELDLGYTFSSDHDFGAKVLFTLALFEPLAHYSSEYDQTWAVRNMYAEMWGFVPKVPWLHIWAGSRMYRGDDIYLLDYWPLDNLNTIGGGLIFDWEGLDVRTHMGVNRLDDEYQYQTIKIPGATFGSADKVYLDRQRWIASAKATYKLLNLYKGFGMKFSAYGEHHQIGKGRRVDPELMVDDVPIYEPETIDQELPKDSGWVAGGQIGLFGFGPYSHINLFAKWAQDLAAYGEAGIPYGTTNDGLTKGAYEFVGALSANWEFKWAGCMAGGYIRKFKDADVNRYDTDDFIEGAISFRPTVFITEHLHQGFEFSYQQHYPFGLDPNGDDHSVSEVYQYSIMEIVSMGRGMYKRPQIRFVYTISQPNGSARDTYPEGLRRPRDTDHFIGFGVEWWFNSSTY